MKSKIVFFLRIPVVLFALGMCFTGCTGPIHDEAFSARISDPAVHYASATEGVMLSWLPVNDVAAYEVWRDNNLLAATLNNRNANRSGRIVFLDTDTQPDSEYLYEVIARARNQNRGNGRWSDTVRPEDFSGGGCGGTGICITCTGNGCTGCQGTGLCINCNIENCTGCQRLRICDNCIADGCRRNGRI